MLSDITLALLTKDALIGLFLLILPLVLIFELPLLLLNDVCEAKDLLLANGVWPLPPLTGGFVMTLLLLDDNSLALPAPLTLLGASGFPGSLLDSVISLVISLMMDMFKLESLVGFLPPLGTVLLGAFPVTAVPFG